MCIEFYQKTNTIKYPQSELDDPLSSLPDELLTHIFSFTDTEQSKATFKSLNKKMYCIANDELMRNCALIQQNDRALENMKNRIFTFKKLPFPGNWTGIRISGGCFYGGTEDGNVKVYDLTTKKEQQTITDLENPLNRKCIDSENCQRFLTSSGLVHLFSFKEILHSPEKTRHLTRVGEVSLHAGATEQPLCFHQGQLYVVTKGRLQEVYVYDFTVSKKESLNQIADLFTSDLTKAWCRFRDELPKEERDQIYGCLYAIMKEKDPQYWEKNGNHWGCAEDAFNHRKNFVISDTDRGEAVRRFASQCDVLEKDTSASIN